MPYTVLEKSGCGIHKGRVKLRIDLFMNPDDPHYEKRYVYVPVFPEEGYPGKVDALGEALDQKDYHAWVLSLPHIWQNNPFHAHFIYPYLDASDNYIKEQMERTLNYFHTFHTHCWDKGVPFIEDWKKVPKRVGEVRCPFERGDPKDLKHNEAKVTNILTKLPEFQIGKTSIIPPPLNIGDKGTITVGDEAIDRASYFSQNYTWVQQHNPASASGTIDTVGMWFGGNATAVSVALFYVVSGNNLSTRDYEDIGNFSGGSQSPVTGLSIDCTSGDYIGAYFESNAIDITTATYSSYGAWRDSGDQIPCTNNAFSLFTYNDYFISLYGTGTEAGGVVIPVMMHHYKMMRS